MLDIATAALSAANTTITILKGLSSLDRQYEKAGVRAEALTALEQANEARAGILKLQEENRGLQEKLTRRVAMHWIPPAYWQKREGQPNDGPFCQQCWDSEEKAIRLQPTQDGLLVCKTCTHVFGDKSSARPPRKAKGSLSDFFQAGT